MDIIILQEGLYNLYPVTKAMFQGTIKPEIVDCFNLCDILKDKLTTYLEPINKYVMKNGSGLFFGCICN